VGKIRAKNGIKTANHLSQLGYGHRDMKRENFMEKRSFTRVLFRAEAIVTYNDKSVRSGIENICLKGAFFKPEEDLPMNEPLEIKIHLSGSSSELSIKVKGKAIRHDQNGIAIQFDGMDLDSFIHLKNVVSFNAADESKIMQEFLDHMAKHRYEISE
jgi:hypothetical protein